MEKGNRFAAALTLAAVVWLSLNVGRALTREPHEDEAWYALPAWNLATNGSMGSPVLETAGSPLPGLPISLEGVHRYTFWVMPIPTVLQAGWYRIAGFSLLTTRLFSTLWAMLLLVAWYFILKKLSGSAGLAGLGAFVISTDSLILERAAFGRMDMFSAACAFSGIAAYLHLREDRLGKAVLAGHSLVMLAGLADRRLERGQWTATANGH